MVMDNELFKLFKSSASYEEFKSGLVDLGYQDSKLNKEVFDFFEATGLDRHKMDKGSYVSILGNLISYQRKQKSTGKKRKMVINLMKAASVAVILSVSFFWVYYSFGDRVDMNKFTESIDPGGSQSVIILSDGSSHAIETNDAYIDYMDESEKVIIQESTKDETILDNSIPKRKVQLNQVYVPYGKQQRLLLSDGTFVYLNSGSKLKYPAVFGGNNREVFLSGEGYFEVKEDSDKPFIVNTSDIAIQVLGTKFNVSSYEDENQCFAVLVEGSVKVIRNESVFVKNEYYLKPNEGFFLSAGDEEGAIKSIDVDIYTSWKNGVFQFTKLPFGEVIHKVQKYYNRSVEIENDDYINTQISGKLYLNNDIELVIESLSRTVGADYVRNDDGIFIFQ